MNTLRLRRGWGIAPSPVFFLTCIGTPIKYIMFVTQLPSWSDGLYFLWGFPALNCFLFF